MVGSELPISDVTLKRKDNDNLRVFYMINQC